MAAKRSMFMLIINAYFSYGSQHLILYCLGKIMTTYNLLFLILQLSGIYYVFYTQVYSQ
jgi:hypothetical protein